MLIYEYKLDGNKHQYAAIDEAIRIVQFIRNKCLRKWMDGRGVSNNDLQCYCATLAREYSFAACLDSQARQASADRAWAAISRFYEMGLKAYYTDSHGSTVANPRYHRKAEKRLKRLHRRLSRKQKGSANRKKARKYLARAYLKVQRQHEDFARKTANALVTSSDLIAYEDLKIANLAKNRRLSKSISDASWGALPTLGELLCIYASGCTDCDGPSLYQSGLFCLWYTGQKEPLGQDAYLSYVWPRA